MPLQCTVPEIVRNVAQIMPELFDAALKIEIVSPVSRNGIEVLPWLGLHRAHRRETKMDNEERKIRAVLDAYVTGFNRGDKDMLLGAFHPNFVSSGFVGGNLQWDSGEEFADFCVEAAPDPDGPVPEWQMEHLTISGQTAVAILRDQWGDRQFRDSLTLLKYDGQWQIAFKAFHGLKQ